MDRSMAAGTSSGGPALQGGSAADRGGFAIRYGCAGAGLAEVMRVVIPRAHEASPFGPATRSPPLRPAIAKSSNDGARPFEGIHRAAGGRARRTHAPVMRRIRGERNLDCE